MIKFPDHKAGLFLSHNSHKDYYKTVEQAIYDEDHGYHYEDWITPEEREEAKVTNECWTLQWYPETPVGFCLASAASLESLLDYVNKE